MFDRGTWFRLFFAGAVLFLLQTELAAPVGLKKYGFGPQQTPPTRSHPA